MLAILYLVFSIFHNPQEQNNTANIQASMKVLCQK